MGEGCHQSGIRIGSETDCISFLLQWTTWIIDVGSGFFPHAMGIRVKRYRWQMESELQNEWLSFHWFLSSKLVLLVKMHSLQTIKFSSNEWKVKKKSRNSFIDEQEPAPIPLAFVCNEFFNAFQVLHLALFQINYRCLSINRSNARAQLDNGSPVIKRSGSRSRRRGIHREALFPIRSCLRVIIIFLLNCWIHFENRASKEKLTTSTQTRFYILWLNPLTNLSIFEKSQRNIEIVKVKRTKK